MTIADHSPQGTSQGDLPRPREIVCDYFVGENIYRSTPESLDRYFMPTPMPPDGSPAIAGAPGRSDHGTDSVRTADAEGFASFFLVAP